MATSALPAVFAALRDLASAALPGLQVHYGVGVTDDPGDFLMIGVTDPDIERAAQSATLRQQRATMAGDRFEMGSINCCALSWNGDSSDAGALAALEAVAETVAAVETILRDTAPTLNLDAVLKTDFAPDDAEFLIAQSEVGASCMAIFSVAYQAQI
jgi:hypothetical protein